MHDNDNYKFGKSIGNNAMAGPYSGISRGGCLIWVVIGVIFLIIALVFVFSSDDSSKSSRSANDTTATESATEASELNEKPMITEGKKIWITDNFSFKIPEGSTKLEPRLGEAYSNEKAFAYEEANGNRVYITSFAVEDEPDCFPDLAEYLVYQGDKNATMGYTSFEDTAMAKSQATGFNADNEKLYVTGYWWPDGGSTLCCVEVASYAKESDVPEFVMSTIGSKEYHGYPADYNPYPGD